MSEQKVFWSAKQDPESFAPSPGSGTHEVSDPLTLSTIDSLVEKGNLEKRIIELAEEYELAVTRERDSDGYTAAIYGNIASALRKLVFP